MNNSEKSSELGRKIPKKFKFLASTIEIPHAPIVRRTVTAADKDLNRWRAILNQEFPLLNPEQITRSEQPFDLLLIHDMVANGDSSAAQELNTIFRKEDRERKSGRYRHLMGDKSLLREQKEKLQSICDTLKHCYVYDSQGQYDSAIYLRKGLGEKFMKDGDIWLAKHFFFSCLHLSKKILDVHMADKIQAEVHCLLAFLARENNDVPESAMALAIDHLAVCRQLSKDQSWQFKPKVLTIKLKKPVAIHGLRFDEKEIYDVVDGCSMTIYMIATLLEHELLISLANHIMHSHKSPTDEDVKSAHQFANHALKLAMEVRQPTAVSSALVRFGLVLRHVGAYEDALHYFEQLKQHCIVTGDYTTEAIAYHNIALCLIGSHNAVDAMEALAKQMDIASDFEMKDLEADGLYEIGHILLQEGHLWEAEECYAVALDDFKTMDYTESREDAAWAMLAVGAGQKLWGRFANLCRSNTSSDIYGLLDWKCSRKALDPIVRPNYKPDLISKSYDLYIEKMKPQSSEDGADLTDYEALTDLLELSSSSNSNKGSFGIKKSVAFLRSHELLQFKSEHGSNEDATDLIDIDNIEFEADYHPRPGSIQAERDRSKKSFRMSVSMNESMRRVVTTRNSTEPSKKSIHKIDQYYTNQSSEIYKKKE